MMFSMEKIEAEFKILGKSIVLSKTIVDNEKTYQVSGSNRLYTKKGLITILYGPLDIYYKVSFED